MGRPKQLAELDGRPLLAHVLAAVDHAPVDRVVVALGGAAGEVLDRVDLGRAEPLVVEEWAAGMGHVLASTLAQAGGGWEAVVVVLGDQPLVRGESGTRLGAIKRSGAGTAVIAAYAARPMHRMPCGRRP